jgi:hypothetical protein
MSAAESTSEAALFAPADSVRHVAVEGLRVILDLKSGKYYMLDEIASTLWSVIIGESDSSGSFENLSREYVVDEDRWRSELTSFAAKCEQEGLLLRGTSAKLASPVPVCDRRAIKPTAWRAWLSLMTTHFAFSRDGFEKIYGGYGQISARPGEQSLEAAVRAFSRAENFFVLRRAPDDCLVRSLALFRFLRLAGFALQHVIAVRRYPFRAHAWVESEGVPLLDDCINGFTPISFI